MKSIILTFDYEMFFGDNPGTVEGAILKPTMLILNELRRSKGKATFFVDYLMLKRMLSENGRTKEEAQLIIRQLKEIVNIGSRIELHIHSHWLDAKYENGKWDFTDYTHYCLNSLCTEKVVELFIEGTKFLNGIAREVEPNYTVKGFRAGGWQVLPFEKLKLGFEAAGILYDSSLMPGVILTSHPFIQDFSKVSFDLYYSFSVDPRTPDKNGNLLEVPISTYRYSVFTFFLSYFLSFCSKERIFHLADGSHVRKDLYVTDETFLRKIYKSRTYSINTHKTVVLRFILKLYSKKVTVFMGHPKDYTSVTMRNLRFLSEKYNLITYLDLF